MQAIPTFRHRTARPQSCNTENGLAGVCTGQVQMKPSRFLHSTSTATSGASTGSLPRLARRFTTTLCLLAAGALMSGTFGSGSIGVTTAAAQSPASNAAPRPTLKQQPHAEISVTKAQYSPEGRLVLCIRITAKDKDVALGTAGDPEKNVEDVVFTLEGSYLENAATKAKIAALTDLPKKPYFGPASIMTQVAKGSWVEMSVAFPALPAPANPAKPDTYFLYTPLKPEPVEIKQVPPPPVRK